MSLSVLSVAYSLATVGSSAVGGAEQVLIAIDRALVEHGHRSVVVACAGSTPMGRLECTPAPSGVLDDGAWAAARREHAAAIRRALDQHAIDIIHLHGVDFPWYLPAAGVPALVTLHLPPSWYASEALAPRRPATFLNCVSHAQRRACPPGSEIYTTIENGVRAPAHLARGRNSRRVVAMGRICPEKGFHIALDAARRAHMRMLLVGQVFAFPSHQHYFTSEILPRLGSDARFVGAVGPRRKQRLLAGARCLLVPSLAPETSSLVAMEALACGTPVVCFSSGALPEIVQHGVTGFVVNDEREMADAILAAGDLNPEACRAAALERFSVERMTSRYLELYHALTSSASHSVTGVER